MGDEVAVDAITHSLPAQSLTAATVIASQAQSSDVIAKAVDSIQSDSGFVSISAANLSSGVDNHVLVDDGSVLTVGDGRSTTPYQAVVYVDPSSGQLSLQAEHGLLLNPHSTAQSLIDGADFTVTEVDGGEDPEELAATAAEQFTVLHNVSTGGALQALDAGGHSIESHGLSSSPLQTMLLKTPSGEAMQVVAIQNLADLAKFEGNRVLQFIAPDSVGILGGVLPGTGSAVSLVGDTDDEHGPQTLDFPAALQMGDALAGILVSTPVMQKLLPPGTPTWATRINECEKIGDSYRGWVESEVELDLLLTLHKQQTNSFWGTRQSPCPAKPSTRLMWKSQYVPFDGLPFINAGSRAIVLECQFGPRRKGAQAKKQTDLPKGQFKQTCPARIYIKKVKKFPCFAVDVNIDKKLLKIEMDKAFISLREQGLTKVPGQERYYIQLPTEGAHEFHGEDHVESPHRLDPRVADKVRELVSSGETRLYAIRKALRKFVEKELFQLPHHIPEKHNLNFYPTVNDLQNHIHQAVKDIEMGLLPVRAQTVKVEVVTGDSCSNDDSEDLKNFPLWQQVSSAEGNTHTESVTVTLTQNPDEDGHHVISKVETHLSDGSTQVTTNLTPETLRLLSKLHPNMFPDGAAFPISPDSGLVSHPLSIHSSQTSSHHSYMDLEDECDDTKVNISVVEIDEDMVDVLDDEEHVLGSPMDTDQEPSSLANIDDYSESVSLGTEHIVAASLEPSECDALTIPSQH